MRKQRPSDIAGRSRFGAIALLPLCTTIACMTPPQSPELNAAAAAADPSSGAASSASGPHALLEGPMGTLDGKQLPATGQAAEVAAGCHIVTTNREAIVQPPGGGVVKVTTSPITFAFVFEPHHRYVIERTVTSVNTQGNGGDVSIRTIVHERDEADAFVRQIPPVSPEYAAWFCANAT